MYMKFEEPRFQFALNIQNSAFIYSTILLSQETSDIFSASKNHSNSPTTSEKKGRTSFEIF